MFNEVMKKQDTEFQKRADEFKQRQEMLAEVASRTRCPVCKCTKLEVGSMMFNGGDESDGDYCGKCWAHFVSKTIPKMIEEPKPIIITP
jgi:hypothetical protein